MLRYFIFTLLALALSVPVLAQTNVPPSPEDGKLNTLREQSEDPQPRTFAYLDRNHKLNPDTKKGTVLLESSRSLHLLQRNRKFIHTEPADSLEAEHLHIRHDRSQESLWQRNRRFKGGPR